MNKNCKDGLCNACADCFNDLDETLLNVRKRRDQLEDRVAELEAAANKPELDPVDVKATCDMLNQQCQESGAASARLGDGSTVVVLSKTYLEGLALMATEKGQAMILVMAPKP